MTEFLGWPDQSLAGQDGILGQSNDWLAANGPKYLAYGQRWLLMFSGQRTMLAGISRCLAPRRVLKALFLLYFRDGLDELA